MAFINRNADLATACNSSSELPNVMLSLENMQDTTSTIMSSIFKKNSDDMVKQHNLGHHCAKEANNMLEPVPIDPKGAIFVDTVPLTTGCSSDQLLLESLNMLIEQHQQPAGGIKKPEDIDAGVITLSESSIPFSLPQGVMTHCHQQCRRMERPQIHHMGNPRGDFSWNTMPALLPTMLSSSEDEEEEVSSRSSSPAGDFAIRNCHADQWNLRYEELIEFRKEYDHCLVPLHWPQNASLAHWVKRQRYQYRLKVEGKHSTLTDERQKMLEDVGFVWDSHAAGWEERWDELRLFKERYGHTNVPKRYPENPRLSVWVKCQRRQFKLFSQGRDSNITTERIERLKVLGFVFDPRGRSRW